MLPNPWPLPEIIYLIYIYGLYYEYKKLIKRQKKRQANLIVKDGEFQKLYRKL